MNSQLASSIFWFHLFLSVGLQIKILLLFDEPFTFECTFQSYFLNSFNTGAKMVRLLMSKQTLGTSYPAHMYVKKDSPLSAILQHSEEKCKYNFIPTGLALVEKNNNCIQEIISWIQTRHHSFQSHCGHITSMDFPIFDIVLHKMNKLHLLAIQQQVEGG